MDQRAQQIVNNLSETVRKKFQDQKNQLQVLSQLTEQYESVSADLIQLKQKYISIINQYSSNDVRRVPSSSFPGIAASPTYSMDKMQADSKQVQEMGSVLNNLESQKQLIYNQIRQTLEAVAATTITASNTVDQISIFLSQMIDDSSNGIYGSSTLKNIL